MPKAVKAAARVSEPSVWTALIAALEKEYLPQQAECNTHESADEDTRESPLELFAREHLVGYTILENDGLYALELDDGFPASASCMALWEIVSFVQQQAQSLSRIKSTKRVELSACSCVVVESFLR